LMERLTAKTEQIEEGIYLGKNFENCLPLKTNVPIPKSTLAMAITLDNQLDGFLVWDHPNDGSAFEHSDILKLARFRRHAVSAISKAWFLRESMEQNEQIVTSLRYAQGIQETLLTLPEHIEEHLGSYFIVSKPKDIISGDLYWLREKRGCLFLAVVDCTGHGVPGAFVSMIGYRLLNKIIYQYDMNDPAQILEKMHMELTDDMRPNYEQSAYDRMDLSLCRIDSRRTRVIYAGARLPIFHVQKKLSGFRATMIKGDIYSVGGRQSNSKRSFINHSLQTEIGDMLFLGSGGLFSQSNQDRQKFGTRRFQSLVERIANLPITAQKERIEEELMRHIGNNKQEDDITLVGLRL